MASGETYSSAYLRELDAAFEWSDSKNCEIIFRWLSLCIRRFLTAYVGRPTYYTC